MLDLRIKKSFFDLGAFPPVVQNSSDALILENPWINGTKAAPFDQRKSISVVLDVVTDDSTILAFYLILDVAVGGTSGWFPDGSEKPWLDGSSSGFTIFTFPEKVSLIHPEIPQHPNWISGGQEICGCQLGLPTSRQDQWSCVSYSHFTV